MDNFDLKKYLAENKLLKEGFQKPEEDSNIESLKKRYWSETPENLETIALKQDSKVWVIGSPEFDADAIQLGDYIKFPTDSQPTLVFKADEKSVNADYDSAEYSKYNRSLLNKMNREESSGNSLNEAKDDSLYYTAGEMISQVGLFTQEKADELEAEGGGNLYRFFNTPEQKAELIKISEEYKNYLAKVKAMMDELINDPMYKVAVGDIGGKYRDRGPGETLQKAYMRAKNI